MDIQKIQVRQDLERMVINYFLMGKISKEQSDRIASYIDDVIGGGFFPEPAPGVKVISFPKRRAEPDSRRYTLEKAEPLNSRVSALRDYLSKEGIALTSSLTWALHELGAYNLETIASISVKKLELCKGVGKKAIARLRAFLQSKGLDMKETGN